MTLLPSLSNWQWGLALFVPLGIVLLYFLKLRRRPIEVPSTLLWRKSIEDLRVNSLWQRLRQSILLLMQLLVAGFLLLALLNPTWNVIQTGQRIILLIDQSASMGTKEEQGTRLAIAQQRAESIIEQMKPGDVAMVIAFDRSAKVLASYTDDHPALRRGVQAIEVTGRSTDVREALTIASALANPQRILEQKGDAEVVPLELSAASGQEATVYLFSDGRFPSASDISLGNLEVEYIKIGNEEQNVGITAMASRPRLDGEGKIEIYARIKNYSTIPKTVTVEMKRRGERVDLRRIELSALSEQGLSFAAIEREVGDIQLSLSPGDALSIDDDAWLVTAPTRPARVLRIGPSNGILDSVLSTPAFAKIAQVQSLPETEKDGDLVTLIEEGKYDLIIFDRCRPKVMPACSTWFIGAIPSSKPGESEFAEPMGTEVKGPAILNWDSVHPIMRFVQIDDVAIALATAVPAGEGRIPLIETDRGLVMWLQNRGVYRDLVLSVPLIDAQGSWQTDWPLKPSFPVMVMNVLRYLAGIDADRGRNLKVGDPLVIRSESPEATILSPDQQETRVPARAGQIEYLDTDNVGLYTVRTGESEELAAVNLFDEEESSIAPLTQISIGAQAMGDKGSSFSSQRSLWRWLALIGLGILFLEWYIYNKRVYI
ncbi:BatA and WFA domain-containing protein [bacterium]|nr:BatA and WFA domain-containing protein [bacterium]